MAAFMGPTIGGSMSGMSSMDATPGSAPPSHESSQAGPPPAGEAPKQKILVVGGNGFLGSRVCQKGLERGLEVISVNRSGPPGGPRADEPWIPLVEWCSADVFDVDKWAHKLRGVHGVVSCIGAFGSDAFMERMCGDANIVAAQAAKEAGIQRFVFISAQDMGLPSFFLRGYFAGKRKAEAAVQELFPNGGVILRPAMIHGTRAVGGINVPLSLVFTPIETVLRCSAVSSIVSSIPLAGPLLAPPLHVDTVASAAINAILDDTIPAGIKDVFATARLGEY
eukprot:jgi/Mesvir1/22709/Mv14123-RA.1